MIRRLLAGLFVVALSQAADLETGQFIVASRELVDPNFAQAVVLIIRYDEEHGAMGLVINRRSDVPLSSLFRDMKEAKNNSDAAYEGGPVEAGSILALMKSASKPDDAEKVLPDVYLVTTKALLAKTLAAKTAAGSLHVFVGYAGWGPGQLEREIDLGAWNIMPAAAAEIFHSDPDSVWPRLIKRTETRIARNYSLRRVSTGSTRIARRAGI